MNSWASFYQQSAVFFVVSGLMTNALLLLSFNRNAFAMGLTFVAENEVEYILLTFY